MSVNTTPTCPTGCAGAPPDMDFNYCSPENAFGEITHIFIAAYDAECFTDVTSLVEWLARADNDSGDPNAIRFMHVKGTKAPGESDTIETSLGRKVRSPMTFTVPIEVDDVSDLNHEFMRATQCNTTFKMWYAAGGYLWGGVCGVNAIINLDYQIEAGAKSIHKIMGAATWEAEFAPERCDNPLVGTVLTD